MFEGIVVVAIIAGIIITALLVAPNTRNRGVNDPARVQRAAESAERDMDRLRDRISERERKRHPPSGRY
ncbi:MAG: hypothetical protein ACFFED_13270 [Candidatus Thorarchaeota archaeon]